MKTIGNKCLLGIGAAVLFVAVRAAWADPNIYERAVRSTGWLIVPQDKATPMGTCWVADVERKLVITSHHLVKEAKEVLVYFPDRVKDQWEVKAAHYLRNTQVINGRVLASDARCDLALIQLERLPAGMKALVLASTPPRPGESVHSVGNSGLDKTGGVLWRYTRGSVRQVYSRKIDTGHGIQELHLIETQSPVNEGDSGGPVLNDQGELVGVAAAYNPKERLVSHNIAASEIQAFLTAALAKWGKHAAAQKQTEELPHVLGAWSVTATAADGTEAIGVARFKKDGTFLFFDHDESDDQPKHGRFAYANGILWLIDEQGAAFLRLAWSGSDQFHCNRNKIGMFFQR